MRSVLGGHGAIFDIHRFWTQTFTRMRVMLPNQMMVFLGDRMHTLWPWAVVPP